jgi:hypothetical protein
MRIGAALTVTLNLPFRQIANASLDLRGRHRHHRAGHAGRDQFSYLMLWPHLRPWHLPQDPTRAALHPDAAASPRLAEAAEARLAEPVVTARSAPARPSLSPPNEGTPP